MNRHPKGEAAFYGEYREIAPPSRLVFTEIFEPFPDAVSVVTAVFTEEDGKTRLTVTARYPSLEVRDMVIADRHGQRRGHQLRPARRPGRRAAAVMSAWRVQLGPTNRPPHADKRAPKTDLCRRTATKSAPSLTTSLCGRDVFGAVCETSLDGVLRTIFGPSRTRRSPDVAERRAACATRDENPSDVCRPRGRRRGPFLATFYGAQGVLSLSKDENRPQRAAQRSQTNRPMRVPARGDCARPNAQVARVGSGYVAVVACATGHQRPRIGAIWSACGGRFVAANGPRRRPSRVGTRPRVFGASCTDVRSTAVDPPRLRHQRTSVRDGALLAVRKVSTLVGVHRGLDAVLAL